MPSKISLYAHDPNETKNITEVSVRTSFSATEAAFYWNLKGDDYNDSNITNIIIILII